MTLGDVAYTLHAGREEFKYRASVVCDSAPAAAAALRALGDCADAGLAEAGASVVFAFPGQGSQYLEMGRGLYEDEPAYVLSVFRTRILPHVMLVELRQALISYQDYRMFPIIVRRYREHFDACCELLKPLADGLDLRHVLFPPRPAADADPEAAAEAKAEASRAFSANPVAVQARPPPFLY